MYTSCGDLHLTVLPSLFVWWWDVVQEFTPIVEAPQKVVFMPTNLISSSGSLTDLLGRHGLSPLLPEARVSSDPAIPVKTKGEVLLPAMPSHFYLCQTGGLLASNCFNLLMQQNSRLPKAEMLS